MKIDLSKKGMVVKFLTALLLALIIYIPACMFGSKMFSVSDQALDNYEDFVEEILDFAGDAESFIGEKKPFLLIMDDETAIVYFNSSSSVMAAEVDDDILKKDYTLYFERPDQCKEDVNCICLFRDISYEVDIFTPEVLFTEIYYQILPGRVLCSEMQIDLEITNCKVGDLEEVNSVSCHGGFVIERNVAEGYAVVGGYEDDPRRRTIQMTFLENSLAIEEKEGK